MELGLRDAVVLVTGATSGIGKAAALAFGREGAKVAITYHENRVGADDTARDVEANGAEAMVVHYDLADSGSIRDAVAAVEKQWGGIDVLVSNAVEWDNGSGWNAPPFEEIPAERWQRTLRTSIDATFHTLQATLPLMRKQQDARIVLLSSGTVEYGMPGDEAYGAAKSALHGLSRSLARDLGPNGIFINIIMPGLVATERNQRLIPDEVRNAVASATPSGRLSAPEDVANAIVFLASRANGNITGEILRVSGGI